MHPPIDGVSPLFQYGLPQVPGPQSSIVVDVAAEVAVLIVMVVPQRPLPVTATNAVGEAKPPGLHAVWQK